MPETLGRMAIAILDEDRSAPSTRLAGTFYPPYFRAGDAPAGLGLRYIQEDMP